ncbi:MAG: ABC transporter permease [Gammaproteobacteria bacterium]|nr:ABC transporter permease [Gammaproteobacteria bacterium]
MNLFTLASRNVYRHRHRSIVTTLAMAFACTMMIVFAALMDGFTIGSERNVVSMNTGDIQIHQPDYRDDPDIYSLIEQAGAIVEQHQQLGFYATVRLFAYGLMASDESSSGVQLRGIELETEPTVTDIDQHVMTGQWLSGDDPHGVVIGKKLSKLLDVSLGDELIFVGQTADGYMANDRFEIRGILKSVSAAIDNGGVFMSNTMLRELITLPKGAHEIVLMRHDRTTDLAAVTAQVKSRVGEQLEVMNWQQLMPIINRFIETAHLQTLIMMIFTYIAVGSVVLNAMLMSVFERIHEFGIMKAIGVKPQQLIVLIYIEMFIQTFLAVLLALGAGSVLSWYIQENGLDMSSLADGISFAGLAFDPVWYAALTSNALMMPSVFLFIIAAIAVIYPAIKVAVIQPVEAIHHQ